MRFMFVLLMTTVVLACSACSAAERYEFVRAMGEASARCESMRTARAEAECRAQYDKTYAEYSAERREVAGRASTRPSGQHVR